jgi:hypothetical protein
MSLDLSPLHVLSNAWADGMGRACWQGALLALLVGAVCRRYPRLMVSTRGWLWWLVSLKLIVGLFCASAVPLPLLPASPITRKPVALSVGPEVIRWPSSGPCRPPGRRRSVKKQARGGTARAPVQAH